jgi:hypothetical protein
MWTERVRELKEKKAFKGLTFVQSRYYLFICLEGLREHKKCSQYSMCPVQDPNQRLPKYNFRVIVMANFLITDVL